MGGGGGIIREVANVITNVSTGGLAGFDGGISLQKGVTGGPTVSAIKDVTGATAAEEANKDARSRFEEEKARELKSQNEARGRRDRDQITKSRLAEGARRTSTISDVSTTTRANLGSDEQDFLGL